MLASPPLATAACLGSTYSCPEPDNLWIISAPKCESISGGLCSSSIIENCKSGPTRLPPDSTPCPSNDCGLGTFRYTLTECDLMRLMENRCCVGGTNMCRQLLPIIVANLERADLNCPARLAGYLAQIRHETAGLLSFYQCIDSGAGAIHMIPANFRRACRGIPALQRAFVDRFGPEGCDGGCDEDAAQIVRCPTFAFATATWWLMGNSSVCPSAQLITEFDTCARADLRTSGYSRVSRCIFGADELGGQREAYYNHTKAVAATFRPQNASQVIEPDQSRPLPVLPAPVVHGSGEEDVRSGACNAGAPCEGIFEGYCCSRWGFCGITDDHCGEGCLNGPCEFALQTVVENRLIMIACFTVAALLGVLLVATIVALIVFWRTSNSSDHISVEPLRYVESAH